MKALLVILSMFVVFNSYGSERKFCKAVIKNRIDKVKNILKNEPQAINYRCKYKKHTLSPLTWSHVMFNQSMSSLLLEKGASLEQSLKEHPVRDIISRIRNNYNCRYVHNCSFIEYLANIDNITKYVTINDVNAVINNNGFKISIETKKNFLQKLQNDNFDFSALIGENNSTMLFFASNIETLKLLVNLGLNVNYKNNLGDSFFTNAIKNKASEDFLLKAAQINTLVLSEPGSNKEIPLFMSLTNNMESLFSYIFNATNPDANITDSSGKSLLHYSFKDIEKVSFLLENGTDINLIDNQGQTALFLAVKNNEKSATFYLLENGACKSIINTQGRTPLSYAIENNNAEIIELLAKYPSDC